MQVGSYLQVVHSRARATRQSSLSHHPANVPVSHVGFTLNYHFTPVLRRVWSYLRLGIGRPRHQLPNKARASHRRHIGSTASGLGPLSPLLFRPPQLVRDTGYLTLDYVRPRSNQDDGWYLLPVISPALIESRRKQKSVSSCSQSLAKKYCRSYATAAVLLIHGHCPIAISCRH